MNLLFFKIHMNYLMKYYAKNWGCDFVPRFYITHKNFPGDETNSYMVLASI